MKPIVPQTTGRWSMNRVACSRLFMVFGSLAVSSCVSVTKLTDEPRMNVSFSSAEAARTFMEAAFVPPTPRLTGAVNFYTIPTFTRPKSAQHRYNDFVRAADTNRDGRISKEEARAFERARHREMEHRI